MINQRQLYLLAKKGYKLLNTKEQKKVFDIMNLHRDETGKCSVGSCRIKTDKQGEFLPQSADRHEQAITQFLLELMNLILFRILQC